MYFVIIAVLSLVLAFPSSPMHWLTDPGWIVAAVCVATVLPAGLAWIVDRGTLKRLEAHHDDPELGQSHLALWMGRVQMLMCALHGAVIGLTHWIDLCAATPVIGRWPGVPGMLAAMPLVAGVTLVLIATYQSDRAIREIALEVNIHRGRPVHPVWSLPTYLAYSLRHQVLFILIPMAFILIARDVIELYEDQIRSVLRHKQAPDLLLGVAAGIVALVAPVMLRYVWVTQPLPDSPLRTRLLDLCRRLRLRCHEILVWRSGGMVVNAAVMGVLPPMRYVMITDAMLEQMEDEKIEAVFGHESGHIKRHHIAFFLLYAFISGCLLTICGHWTQKLDHRLFGWVLAGLGAFMLLKWGVLFGVISRLFERQADLYGVRTLALAGIPCERPCAMHTADARGVSKAAADPMPIGAALCASAANVFSDTLNDVARLNGIPPESPSWRHGSIASRSRLVQKLASDPVAAARFERKVERVKLAIFASAVFCAAWAVLELKLWQIIGL